LNGTRPVTPGTQALVEDAIKQLHYRPNPVARGLATGDYKTIGVVNSHMGSDYYAIVMRGIQKGLIHTNYQPIFAGDEDPQVDVVRTVEALLNRGAEALILLDHKLPDKYVLELAENYPLVTVNRIVPGLEPYAQLVDDVAGGYKATRHLIDMGHTRIVHILTDGHFPGTAERLDGYRQAHADYGLEVDEQLILKEGGSVDVATQFLDHLLAEHVEFTAVFAQMDFLAMGVLVALYHQGIVVPDEVSVIGYDDHNYAQYTVPPLTTIRQNMSEIGTRAARAVLKRLDGKDITLTRVPVELIVRESTAACRRK
jgi:LacI family transcriptional regulator